MKLNQWMVLFLLFPPLSCASDVIHKGKVGVLLRYENESGHNNLKHRERIRTIAHAGLQSTWTENWNSQIRLRTGLKNKQNVPAITIHRFNDQPQPDSDLFIDRAFVTGHFDTVSIVAGKIPWSSKQITDIFWDRDLNPIGASADWQIADNHALHFTYFKPLDGQSHTIGDMAILQWQTQWQLEGWHLAFMPWFVDYRGESGAEYARKDTALDNRFIRLSTFAKSGQWQFGVDYGHSLENADQLPLGEFNDQTDSLAFELKYGGLKKANSWLIQLRAFRVERFSVIGEFSQNAVSRFGTNNLKGWDIRARKKMDDQWWLGMRYSDTETLVGEKEKGKRFRVEAKYVF